MSTIISAVVGTLLALKRTCPVCKRDQIVPKEKQDMTVNCKFCGAAVPPAAKKS